MSTRCIEELERDNTILVAALAVYDEVLAAVDPAARREAYARTKAGAFIDRAAAERRVAYAALAYLHGHETDPDLADDQAIDMLVAVDALKDLGPR